MRALPIVLAPASLLTLACEESDPTEHEVKAWLSLGFRDHPVPVLIGVPIPLAIRASLGVRDCVPRDGWLGGQDCTTSTQVVAVEVVDLACTGAECRVTGELEVVGGVPGHAHVVAMVRAPHEHATLTGGAVPAPGGDPNLVVVSTDLHFDELESFDLVTYGNADAGAAYASLVGARLDWWARGRFLGGAWSVPEEVVDVAWTGDAVEALLPAIPYGLWETEAGAAIWAGGRAVRAGTATLTVQGLGATREETVRVAAPEEVVGISLAAAAPIGLEDVFRVEVTEPWLEGADPVEAIEVEAGGRVGGLAVVLALADGALALGGAGCARIDPPDLAEVSISVGNATASDEASDDARPVFFVEGSRPGAGTLTIEVGAVAQSFPVVVSAEASGGAGGAQPGTH